MTSILVTIHFHKCLQNWIRKLVSRSEVEEFGKAWNFTISLKLKIRNIEPSIVFSQVMKCFRIIIKNNKDRIKTPLTLANQSQNSYLHLSYELSEFQMSISIDILSLTLTSLANSALFYKMSDIMIDSLLKIQIFNKKYRLVRSKMST